MPPHIFGWILSMAIYLLPQKCLQAQNLDKIIAAKIGLETANAN